jgi:WD40 repeat protein
MPADGSFRRLTNHLDQMKDAAFSPDSRLLATASVDSTIRLWEAATGRELTVLRGHLSQVDSVAFAEDGVTLASLEENQGVRLWHLPTRREVAVLPMDKAGGWLGFVPGGQTLTLRLSGGGLRLLPAPEPVRETGGR